MSQSIVNHDDAGRPVPSGVLASLGGMLGADADERFRMVFDHAPIGQIYTDFTGRITSVNDALATMLGYRPDEMIGHFTGEFLSPESFETVREDAYALLADATVERKTRYFRHREGHDVPVAVISALLRDDSGQPRWWVSMTIDLTDDERRTADLERAHAAAVEGEARFRSVFDNSPLPMALTQGDSGTFGAVNAAFCAVLGRRPDELIGCSAPHILHPDDRHLADPAGAAAMASPDGRSVTQMRFVHSSGDTLYFNTTLSWITGPDGTSQLLAHFEDVTAFRAAENALRWQADHDALTGLLNRFAVARHLAELGERATRNAVLFVDIDAFKLINDTRGHDAGDEVLVAVARRLRDVVRPTDLVARFGVDEFVVVCPFDDAAEPRVAGRIADDIDEALSVPIPTTSGPAKVTVSVGIAEGTIDPREPQRLIQYADAAMNHAKALGRARRAFYDDELHQRAQDRVHTEAVLRTALDDGRFVLHLQPIVRLDTSSIVGFEALVRLLDDNGSLVPPGEFIAVAEQSGLVVPMGTWVIQESCRILADLRARTGRPLTISVNVAARQAARPDLASIVLAALGETNLPASALTLELTESALLEAHEETLAQLVELRACGVGIALDDFGTGYSSLTYLRRLPVSALKIDRSFVVDMMTTSADRAIVRAVASLAGDLGLQWVAEGVETVEQRRALRGIGGGLEQGFLFSRPLPLPQLYELLGLPA